MATRLENMGWWLQSINPHLTSKSPIYLSEMIGSSVWFCVSIPDSEHPLPSAASPFRKLYRIGSGNVIYQYKKIALKVSAELGISADMIFVQQLMLPHSRFR